MIDTSKPNSVTDHAKESSAWLSLATESASEHPWLDLFNHMAAIVFRLDHANCICAVNSNWALYTARDPASVIGQAFTQFIPATEHERLNFSADTPYLHQSISLMGANSLITRFALHALRETDGLFGILTPLSSPAATMAPTQNQCLHWVQNLSEIIFHLGADYTLRYINPAWQTLTGYSPEASLGTAFMTIVHPEDRRQLETLFSAANFPLRQEIRLQSANSAWLWMSMRINAVQLDTEYYLVGTLQDITEHKQLEIALRKNEERYAILAASTTDGIWDWNLLTQEVYFSPRWKSMLGYAEHELDNTFYSWRDRVHPDDLALALQEVQKCIQGETEIYENIHRLKHRAGHWVWIFDRGTVQKDAHDNPIRMVGSHSDLTLLKQAEEAAQKREQELQAIFSVLPDGIVLISAQGTINNSNPAFSHLTGLHREALLDLSEADLHQALYQRCNPEQQNRHKKKDGNLQFFLDLTHLSATPAEQQPPADLSNPNPPLNYRVLACSESALAIPGFAKLLCFRDITSEYTINQLKSRFLSTAAHELRTPMASVFGFSELLLSRQFDQATTTEILQTIHNQSASLVNMINQLLDLARIEAKAGMEFNFVLQPIKPIVATVVRGFIVSGDQRTVKFSKSRIDAWANLDEEKIQQVLTNVLSNAFKYSPNGGDINLKLARRQNSAGKAEVGVIIADQGIGMTETQLQHVFERFWRAESFKNIPGTGLGMSLVKEIMDIHQGSIEISSQYGKGTVVSLWFTEESAPL